MWALPAACSIEPINICNLKCPECPTGIGTLRRPKGMISVPAFSNLISTLSGYVWHVNLYFQGEPFMHPEFTQLIRIAKQKRIVLSTSTNGHYLTSSQAKKIVKSGLDVITISIDGITQEVYEQYRINGSLPVVLEGLKNLIQAKKQLQVKYPLVKAQFLVFRHNESQISTFKEMAYRMGVDLVEIKTAQLYEVEKKVDWIPVNLNYSRYETNDNGSIQIKGKYKNKCWKQWSSSVITWDGKVAPCCFDKDVEFLLGNALETGFETIWSRSGYSKFRKQVIKAQEKISICTNCPIARSYTK
jgi:radical SAM protein with 4Fe4S-binding SPASM domain